MSNARSTAVSSYRTSSRVSLTGIPRSVLEDLDISRTNQIPEPPWQREAACYRLGYDNFFPNGIEEARCKIPKAKDVCSSCPVKAECLKFAIETESVHGVWGGMTRGERKKLTDELEERGVGLDEWFAEQTGRDQQ